jgi:hypothetical protein
LSVLADFSFILEGSAGILSFWLAVPGALSNDAGKEFKRGMELGLSNKSINIHSRTFVKL